MPFHKCSGAGVNSTVTVGIKIRKASVLDSSHIPLGFCEWTRGVDWRTDPSQRRISALNIARLAKVI